MLKRELVRCSGTSRSRG